MSTLTILCYDCGVMFILPDGTPNPSKQCPKCKESKELK